MRNSRKIIWTAAGIVILLMVAVMILGRIAIGWGYLPSVSRTGRVYGPSWKLDEAPITSMNPALADFDEIRVEGDWTVHLLNTAEYSVDLSFPEPLNDGIVVDVEGRTLVLSCDASGCSDSGPEAHIGMPSLSVVGFSGRGDLYLSGFHEDLLELNTEGGVYVAAEDSSVENAFIRLDGVGCVDLEGMIAENARVELDGAGVVKLFMDGGVLDGSLDGWGRILYSGNVSEQLVDIDGRGSVRRR